MKTQELSEQSVAGRYRLKKAAVAAVKKKKQVSY